MKTFATVLNFAAIVALAAADGHESDSKDCLSLKVDEDNKCESPEFKSCHGFILEAGQECAFTSMEDAKVHWESENVNASVKVWRVVAEDEEKDEDKTDEGTDDGFGDDDGFDDFHVDFRKHFALKDGHAECKGDAETSDYESATKLLISDEVCGHQVFPVNSSETELATIFIDRDGAISSIQTAAVSTLATVVAAYAMF